MKKIKLFIQALFMSVMNLRLFDAQLLDPQITTTSDLTAAMKTFYSDYLLKIAEPHLVHDQFALKKPIGQRRGKTIEFRGYDPFPKALTPLVEGMKPTGRKPTMFTKTATVYQYGDYSPVSDILYLTAIDPEISIVTQRLGNQAGRTLDTITRDVIVGGTNVIYASATPGRHNITASDKMTPDLSFKARTVLAAANAEPINGSYVAIIHPYCSYDLMRNEEWIKLKDYYNGEIGKIGNVRYVETSEAKIFHGADLCAATRTLTSTNADGTVTLSNSNKTATVLVSDTLVADALIGRYVISNGKVFEVTDNGTGSIEVVDPAGGTITATDLKNKTIYPGEGGAAGCAVFAIMVLGAEAYATTEIQGGGLKHIFHGFGSGGVFDPLDQMATAGWKATKAVCRLNEDAMLRIECGSTYSGTATAN